MAEADDPRTRRCTAKGRWNPVRLWARLPNPQNNWGAALIFAIAVGALLWPVLVGDRVLLPSSILYFIPPWSTQKPPDVNSYFNPVLSDIPTAYYPWWTYARESLRSWHVPQWNPYALAGTPFYANPQSAFFSPFSLPLWLLPYKFAFGVAAALRLWVTAFGTYLLCRELRLSFWPSILGGLAFGFSAFSILWLSYPVLNVLAFLPWALWLGTRVLRSGLASDALLLAVILALALLGGHPGSELHLYAILLLYAALTAAVQVSPIRDRLRRLGFIVAAMVAGAALTAFVLIPVARAVPGTVGVEARSGGALTIPASALRTLFFPDWWGRPNGIFFGGPFNYNERTVYAGAAAFLLALVGLSARSFWRSTLPFGVLAFVGLEAAFGLQPINWILVNAPALSNDRNARLSLLIQFSAAILAAFGLEALLARPPSRAMLLVVVVGMSAVIGGGLLATHPSFQEIRTALHHFRTGDNFARPHVIELVSVGWWMLLALLLLAAFLARRAIGVAGFAVVVIVVAALDYGHFARNYNPLAPSDRAVPVEPPAVRFLKGHVQNERFVGLGVVLPPDTSTEYRLEDVRGNDPPYPDKRFMRFFRLINPVQPANDWLVVPSLTTQGRKMLNLLNVRYVVAPPGTAGLRAPGLTLSYRGADADVYRDDHALPRSFIPATITSVPTEGAVLGRLSSSRFRPGREAVVQGRLGLRKSAGTVLIERDEPEHVVLRASLRRRSLVVLSNAFHAGWSVSVDGHHRRPLRVDAVLQGVVVSPGRHTIRWTFRTPGLVEGSAVSVAGFVGVVSWVLIVAMRRRRSSEERE